MLVFFLLVVIAALVLGILGALVHGLFYLLIIGIVILIADGVFLAVRSTRRRRGSASARPIRSRSGAGGSLR